MVTAATLVLAGMLAAEDQTPRYALSPPRGWLTPEAMDQALTTARERDRLIAWLFVREQTDREEEAKASIALLRHRGLRRMVRVFVGSRDINQQIEEFTTPVRRYARGYPRLVITAPDLTVLGLVRTSSVDRAGRMLKLVDEAVELRDDGRRQVDQARGLARAGRFDQAIQDVRELVERDRALAEIVRVHWVGSPATREELVEAAREGEQPASALKLGMTVPSDFNPDQGPFWFGELEEQVRGEFERILAERLAEAKRLMAGGESRRAAALLRPVVGTEAKLRGVEEARKLLAEAEGEG
jgi:hypothetical protein